MITLVDNFDSFTYNIVAALEKLGEPVNVVRNTVSVRTCLDADGIILGPGPGRPEKSGVCRKLIGKLPLLGICLGHQLLGQVFGGRTVRTTPCHGKVSRIYHNGEGLFSGLPQGFKAVRYHSLIVKESTLDVTAWTEDGLIMGLRHPKLPLFGVQFHPDSISTEYGLELFRNFIIESRRLGRENVPAHCSPAQEWNLKGKLCHQT